MTWLLLPLSLRLSDTENTLHLVSQHLGHEKFPQDWLIRIHSFFKSAWARERLMKTIQVITSKARPTTKKRSFQGDITVSVKGRSEAATLA